MSAKPKKSGVRIGGDNKTGHAGSEINDRKKIDSGEVDGDKVENDEIEKKV